MIDLSISLDRSFANIDVLFDFYFNNIYAEIPLFYTNGLRPDFMLRFFEVRFGSAEIQKVLCLHGMYCCGTVVVV